jgi:hypothetical protein
MPITTVEQLLVAWATWSRLDLQLGPNDAGCGSAESAYRSPQCWDERRPRVVIIDDESALRIEKAVIGTGPILAAALRTHYIRQRPPHTRAQVQVLLEAQRRVGALLGASGCATDAPERPPRRAADAGATRTSPDPF